MKWKQYFLSLIVFLLPWQTQLFLSSDSAGSFIPYTSIGFYAIDFFMLVAVLLSWRTVYAWLRGCHSGLTVRLVSCFIGFAVAFNISTAAYPMIAAWKIVTLMLLFLFGLVLVKDSNKEQLRFAFLLSAVLQSCLALGQFFLQSITGSTLLGIAEQFASTGGVSVVETATARFLRAYGSFPHPNILGGFLALALIAVVDWYFAAYEDFQTWWNAHGAGNKQLYKEPVVRKMAVLASLLLAAVTIILSGLYVSFSRSAVIALVLSLAVYGMNKYWNNRVRAAALGFKLSLVFLMTVATWTLLIPGLWSSRISSSGRLDVLSTTTRLTEYKESVTLLKNHFISGVGIQNVVPALMSANPGRPPYSYQPVHNIFFLILLETGLLGLAVLIMVALLYKERLRTILREGSPAFVSALFALLILGLFDHYLWTLHAGLLLWFIPTLLYEPLRKKVIS